VTFVDADICVKFYRNVKQYKFFSYRSKIALQDGLVMAKSGRL